MSNVGIDFEGLEHIRRIRQNVERLQGTTRMEVEVLLTADFMRKHTKFASMNEMFARISIGSREDFDAVSRDVLDAYVNANSHFTSWQELLNFAATERLARELFD